MSNYHDRIMNISATSNNKAHVFSESDVEWTAYRYGHKDARHAAAEIALEAEAEIERLNELLDKAGETK